tara:strand:- start:180 stop:587 length:408 start_codon:yes stop_codon:yes gene_type:complete
MAFNSKVNTLIVPVLIDLDAGASTPFTWTLNHPMVIHRFEFVVKTAVVATSTAPVVSLDHTDTVGSVARAEKGTISIANTTAAGACKEPSSFTPFYAQDTDILHFEHKTQGAGGSTAGDGYFILYYESIPDNEVA